MLRWFFLFWMTGVVWGQVCRLSVAGLNRNRKAFGDISAECPDPLHTAPFGNWGVTSNFGTKRDGRQFDGWCHDMRVCDNSGNCRNVCRDGWYEWNSCTTNALYRAPNCTLYNDKECTAQKTSTDVNVLGTQTVDLAVACPTRTAGSETLDRGGCAEVRNYGRTNNFMSVYELDPVTGDELIQSLYFPSLLVDLKCNAWGCGAAGSEWLEPAAYDSPVTPKIFAEMAMVVNSGTFVDTSNRCTVPAVALRAGSAATYVPVVTAESLATLFTGDVTALTETAGNGGLPVTLAGVQVRITDAGGTARVAPLVFASPRQINLVVPAGVREGTATVAVMAGNAVRASGTVEVARVQPGIFTANGAGTGTAAAVGIRVKADGTQESTVSFTCEGGVCRAVGLDMGGSQEQFVLVLFGTGIRGRSGLNGVTATIGGLAAEVQYAGAQPTFAGLDQVNLLVPKSLAGRGEMTVQVVVDGRAANPVTVVVR